MSTPTADRYRQATAMTATGSARPQTAEAAIDRAWPRVSVIVPVRNEGRTIDAVLASLTQQDYPAARLEILVVDGRSSDDTRRRVARWAGADARIRLLDNPGEIVPSALNRALWSAHGQIVVRADGHTRYASDYVRSAVAVLEETGADVVGGPMRPAGCRIFGRAVAAALTSPLGVGGSSFHFADRRGETDSVYLGIFHRDVFERVGGFDEYFVRNQDDEWFYRARAAGARIVLDPSIRSTYQPREDWWALARQYFGYGLYKPAVLARTPGALRARHLAPSVLVAGLLTLAVAAWFVPPARGALVALSALYALALMAGAAITDRGRRPGSWPVVALTMATMHVAYGLGFLVGLRRRSPGGDTETLRATYRRYREDPRRRRAWDAGTPGQRALVEERVDAQAEAIRERFGAACDGLRILDVGAGRHDLAGALEARGVRAVWLVSLDLLEERLRESPCSRRVAADGSFLPFAPGTFDVVIQSTVLSSIGARATRRIVAAEMLEVVAEKGLILSYDARWPNPFNRRVRRLGRAEHRRLFAPAAIRFRRLTVIPWLVRRWAALARTRFGRAFDLAIILPERLASRGGRR